MWARNLGRQLGGWYPQAVVGRKKTAVFRPPVGEHKIPARPTSVVDSKCAVRLCHTHNPFQDVAELKADDQWRARYLESAKLVALACGWDIEKGSARWTAQGRATRAAEGLGPGGGGGGGLTVGIRGWHRP